MAYRFFMGEYQLAYRFLIGPDKCGHLLISPTAPLIISFYRALFFNVTAPSPSLFDISPELMSLDGD